MVLKIRFQQDATIYRFKKLLQSIDSSLEGQAYLLCRCKGLPLCQQSLILCKQAYLRKHIC